MAKLYFYYASMNAGKSTTLLQADFNYRERGMETMLFTAAVDDRFAHGTITSRIGLEAPATPFEGTNRTWLRDGTSGIPQLVSILRRHRPGCQKREITPASQDRSRSRRRSVRREGVALAGIVGATGCLRVPRPYEALGVGMLGGRRVVRRLVIGHRRCCRHTQRDSGRQCNRSHQLFSVHE